MTFVAGQRLTAALLNSTFPGAKTDVQATLGNTTSSTYTTTLSGGTACGLTFVAPLSGIVTIINTAMLDQNSSTVQTALMSYNIKTGGTIGSGTSFLAANDDDAVRNLGTTEQQWTYARTITGLTAGATYNVQQAFRGTGGTQANFSRKSLSVLPTT